ncbi:MAG: HAS-barrel domain-containing protein [Cyanobacteria bacterium P01_G01_bin.54]
MRVPLPQFTPDQRHPEQLGEVIETSTVGFLAQCLEPETLDFPTMPPFGSWVQAQDEESGNQVLAVVTHATTSPIDSVHRARALGLSLAELREEQPQIFAMLKTEFQAAIVGFIAPKSSGDRPAPMRQYLPPRPPQIHQAVYRCAPETVMRFSEELHFLRSLLQVNAAPTEALVAAALREIFRLRRGDRAWLVNAGRTLGILLKDDYDTLRYILAQVHL